MELSDGIVLLRPWGAGDVPEMTIALNDPEIERWLDGIPQPYTEEDARFWIGDAKDAWESGDRFNFAVTERKDDRVLGGIGMRVLAETQTGEVGYWVRAEARGNGVATRALELIAPWAFESRGIERLQLYAEIENIPSQRVAEKAGFRRDGVIRSWRRSALGRRPDFALYSLLPGELD
jgi:RimJ/RimL family protein N-acetyltransferase